MVPRTRHGVSKALAVAIAIAVILAGVSAGLASYAYHLRAMLQSRPSTTTVTTTVTKTVTLTKATTKYVTTTKTVTTLPSHTPAPKTKTTTVTLTSTSTITKTTTTTAVRTSTVTATPATHAIVVKDLAGRTVKLPHIARRVVVLQSYWAEDIVALGKASAIVGIGDWVAYDQYLPKSVRSKPTVGSLFKGVNIEEIAALKPDVVITDYGYGEAPQLISKLKQLGIPVICMFVHNLTDEIKAIEILGKVLGAQARAESLINFIKSRIEEIESLATHIPASKRLKVVVIDGLSVLRGGELTIYANTSWGRSVEEVGAVNLGLKNFPSQRWPKIDFETLLKWNPDAIIVTASPGEVQKVLDYIQGSVKWHALKAYQTGRIYAVPCWSTVGGVLDWGPRDVIGVEYIAKVLYPTVYKDIHWRLDMEALLTKYYGVFIPAQAFASYSIRWKKVIDLSNHTLTLPRKVTRVVDFISYQLDLALGVMNRLVGISKFARFNPVLMKAYPNVTKIPSPGSSFFMNVEDVAALKPQLVLLFPFKPTYAQELQKLGIPVLKVWLFSYKDIERLVWLLGTIYDVRPRAQKIISEMNDLLSLVRSRVANIPQSERVRVLYLWGTPTTVEGGHGTVNDFIRLAGGINVAAKAFPNRDYVKVNLEQIIKWNPQIIVIWWWARYNATTILHNPDWSVIAAVKHHMVFKEPYYEHWSPDASIFILWLAMKMYPSRFQGINFTSIANKYYEDWYGIPYTAVSRG